MSPRPPVKRVCLAYSGGLDTSVILHWLIEAYDCEVVAYCAGLLRGCLAWLKTSYLKIH